MERAVLNPREGGAGGGGFFWPASRMNEIPLISISNMGIGKIQSEAADD